MPVFKQEGRNWVDYRKLPGLVEVDLHWADQPGGGAYWENMQEVHNVALHSLQEAFEQGAQWVLFTHGWSTSHRGKTTSRSVVRSLMRSPAATPYIVRRESIQHYSVFVARIRQKSP
jgi:hypothetical protein